MTDIIDTIDAKIELDREGKSDTVSIEFDGERITPDIVMGDGDILTVNCRFTLVGDITDDDDDDDYRIDGDLK